jgi:lysophospholipase L1-like esterase
MLFFGVREYLAMSSYRASGWLADPLQPAGAASTAPCAQDGSAGGAEASWRHPGGPLVILGASYAAGLTLQPIAGHAVVNRGVPGQQSGELRARFDQDVVAAQPRAVVIWGYINDIFRADPARMDEAVARAKDNVRAMVTQSRAAGIEPILATELTIRGEDTWSDWVGSWIGWLRGKASHQERINGYVAGLNDWLRTYARDECLAVVDLHGTLSDQHGVRRREYATPDGSHIPPAGYDALRAYLTPQLTRHLAP